METEEKNTETWFERFGGLRIAWRGVGREALLGMSKRELVEYTGMLEATLELIHRHFYYYNPPTEFDTKDIPYAELGFDGNLTDIGSLVMRAALIMYKVHATPFQPVPVPAGAVGVTRLKTKA